MSNTKLHKMTNNHLDIEPIMVTYCSEMACTYQFIYKIIIWSKRALEEIKEKRIQWDLIYINNAKTRHLQLGPLVRLYSSSGHSGTSVNEPMSNYAANKRSRSYIIILIIMANKIIFTRIIIMIIADERIVNTENNDQFDVHRIRLSATVSCQTIAFAAKSNLSLSLSLLSFIQKYSNNIVYCGGFRAPHYLHQKFTTKQIYIIYLCMYISM